VGIFIIEVYRPYIYIISRPKPMQSSNIMHYRIAVYKGREQPVPYPSIQTPDKPNPEKTWLPSHFRLVSISISEM